MTRTVVATLLLLSMWAGEARAQAGPTLDVGVRPSRVRVGDTYVLTVRLTGGGWPDVLDVEGLAGGEVLDVRDRNSAALGRGGANLVLERDFVVRALQPGNAAPAGVFAVWGPDTVRAQVPQVTAVGSPLAWNRSVAPKGRDRADIPLQGEGRPPTATGRDADRERAPEGLYPPFLPGVPGDRTAWGQGVLPGGQGYGSYPGGQGYGAYPGGQGYGAYPWGTGGSYLPTSPYAPSGWGVAPPGRGWAPSAAGDPWWPELVPRLERYESAADDPTGLVRLEAGLTPQRVYEGQQVTLVATATFAPEAMARLGTTPEFFPPSAGEAWAVEIPYAPPTPAAVGGRVQEAHTFMRAFFPVAPGTLTVEPARLRFGMGSGGSAGRPQDELATEALSVEVLPVPTREAPQGWSGAVGRYRVSAWVQPESVGWGEAALLTVEVAGVGNVRDLARPDPGQVWGAELRATGERAYVEVRDGVVGGVKTFSWLVVPVEPGGLRIGPVIFPYFDPWLGTFAQVASEEVLLEARPFVGGGGAVSPGGGRGVPYASQSPGFQNPGAPSTQSGLDGAQVAEAQVSPSRVESSPTPPPQTPAPRTPAPGGPGASTAEADPPGPDTSSGGPPHSDGDAPEAEARRLLARLDGAPRDGDAWLALSRRYREGRAGEGWEEWALLSGVRQAPRHPGLRDALRRDGLSVGGGPPGVPRLPFTALESLLLAAGTGTVGLALLTLALRTAGGGMRRRARAGVASLVLASALGLSEPWWVLRHGDDVGVAVEGPVALRTAPTWSSERHGSLESGTPVTLGRRYGDWVQVSAGSERGWAETVQVVPLGS